MRFFRRLKAAWSFWKSEPYISLPANFWLRGDSERLSLFLSSETGLKLGKLLSNRIAQSAVQATLKNSTPYDSGYAGGCRGTATFIDSLLEISLPTSESLDSGEAETQAVHDPDRYRA